jgi:hypothetical protein
MVRGADARRAIVRGQNSIPAMPSSIAYDVMRSHFECPTDALEEGSNASAFRQLPKY